MGTLYLWPRRENKAMNLNYVLEEIGDRVRAERKARNLTRKELARRAGMSDNGIKRLEEGRGCYLTTLLQIGEALSMPMSDLLSANWKLPQKLPSLTQRQSVVLGALAEGGSLFEAGARIGLTGQQMASHLSLIYRRLGLQHRYEYRDDRRAAAIQIAREHHLINEGTYDEAHG